MNTDVDKIDNSNEKLYFLFTYQSNSFVVSREVTNFWLDFVFHF